VDFLLVFVKTVLSAKVYLQKRRQGDSWLLHLPWHHRCWEGQLEGAELWSYARQEALLCLKLGRIRPQQTVVIMWRETGHLRKPLIVPWSTSACQ